MARRFALAAPRTQRHQQPPGWKPMLRQKLLPRERWPHRPGQRMTDVVRIHAPRAEEFFLEREDAVRARARFSEQRRLAPPATPRPVAPPGKTPARPSAAASRPGAGGSPDCRSESPPPAAPAWPRRLICETRRRFAGCAAAPPPVPPPTGSLSPPPCARPPLASPRPCSRKTPRPATTAADASRPRRRSDRPTPRPPTPESAAAQTKSNLLPRRRPRYRRSCTCPPVVETTLRRPAAVLITHWDRHGPSLLSCKCPPVILPVREAGILMLARAAAARRASNCRQNLRAS